jgi:hypothetical protein
VLFYLRKEAGAGNRTRAINEAVKKSGDRFLTDKILTKMFATFWPQLETHLTEIKNQQEVRTAPRPERELLEEMLEILRSQEQRVRKERDEKRTGSDFQQICLSKLGTRGGSYARWGGKISKRFEELRKESRRQSPERTNGAI